MSHPPSVVCVLGAGTMGRGIARVAAGAGHRVLLHDTNSEATAAALDEIRRRLGRDVERGRLDANTADTIRGRVAGIERLEEAAGAGIFIEAIVEELEAKVDLLRQVEAVSSPGAVIATNTSSLSIDAIAAGLADPGRFAGMHFFNPAELMPLVEVISGDLTEPAVTEVLVETASAWGKVPVQAAATPGFIVNRVARPYYSEALWILEEEGVEAAEIDWVMTEVAGFPLGPFAVMDLVGLDVNLAVSTSVYEQTGDPRFAPAETQRRLVATGRLGRKSGAGFHRYPEPEPAVVQESPEADPAALVTVNGDAGWATPLVSRLSSAGLPVKQASEGSPVIRFDGVAVALTDGRSAAEMAEVLDRDLLVLDLVGSGDAVCLASSPHQSSHEIAKVQATLDCAGIQWRMVADVPGVVAMRIIAQLASVAADAVLTGVASPADIDTAMRLGTSYPRGPLEWADALGPDVVVSVLDHLHSHYGDERYRASDLLRAAADQGTGLRKGAGG